MAYNPYYTTPGSGGNTYDPKYKEMYKQLYGNNYQDIYGGNTTGEDPYGSAASGTGNMEQPIGGGFADPHIAGGTGLSDSDKSFSKVGGIATSAASGLANAAADISAVKQARQINFRAPASGTDAYGRPMYNLGQLGNDLRNFKVDYSWEDNLTRHLAKTSVAAGKGFSEGGWIGAAIEAGITSAGDWYNQNEGRKVRRQKRAQGEQRLASGQKNYNLREQMWRDQQASQDYYNQMQSQYGQRVQNLYGGRV